MSAALCLQAALCLKPTQSAPSAMLASEFRFQLVKQIPNLERRAIRLVRTREAALELVQDSLERALRFESHVEAGTNLPAWLHTLMYRVFVTQFRRQVRTRRTDLHLQRDPCSEFRPEYGLETATLGNSLAQSLQALPPAFRDVVVLVDVEASTYREAAAELGIPLGTVMSRLARGRRMLRQGLTRERNPERVRLPG